MSRIVGVIPARMGSSRFPGKPLAKLRGRPMIEHVFRATAACAALDEVVIATCDEEIARAARAFGARAVMTSAAHERATDRVAEACADETAGIVVMVQGDEPMILPSMIDQALAPFAANPQVDCVNLMAPVADEAEFASPNTIKVVCSDRGTALYFSRAPIPARAGHGGDAADRQKQVCVIAFRRDALLGYSRLTQGPLEIAESVDMLRFLEHGIPVHLAPTAAGTQAVDTPADLARVEALMAGRGT